jgi:diaminopimelate epimerase
MVDHGKALMRVRGRRFWKMSGSGNDFVFFDARREPPGVLESPPAIAAVCERRTGIGGDGIVLLEEAAGHAFGIRYFNRDGSLAELCGNASLCSVTLARELGIVKPSEKFSFLTSSGPLQGRVADGLPEIDASPVAEAQADYPTATISGERRIGYARVGVPHLVVLVEDLDAVDVQGRGRELRYHSQLPAGANANFVGPVRDGWAMRTYERGVEEETLACGTGAAAICALMTTWDLVEGHVALRTRSGSVLTASLREGADGTLIPSLRGEGRIVYVGEIGDLPPVSAG